MKKDRILIITNNELVKKEFKNNFKVILLEGSYLDVILDVRNRIHLGNKLVTHPILGRLRPAETPFISVAVEPNNGNTHEDSIYAIEYALGQYKNNVKEKDLLRQKNYRNKILTDYITIDFQLFKNAILES